MSTKKINLFIVMILILSIFNQTAVNAKEEKNLALGKPVVVSGVEGGTDENGEWLYPHLGPEKLTDGDKYSRWSSDASLTDLNLNNNPDQNVWAYVDLQESKSIGKVIVRWDTVGSRNYDIQISEDAKEWEVLKHYEDPNLMGKQYDETLELEIPRQARYIRVYARVSTEYENEGNVTWYAAISIREIEVYESSKETGQNVLDRICQIDPVLSNDQSHIILPDSGDKGMKVSIFGTSNPAVIAMDGSVVLPLQTTKVNIFYEVTDEKENKYQSDTANEITIPGRYSKEQSINKCPDVVPSIREWKGNEGNFKFTGNIVINNENIRSTAESIKMYFKEMLNRDAEITVGVPQDGDIYLQLTNNTVVGEEGYEMNIDNILTVMAPSLKGLLYGGTSITQILSQDNEHMNIPKGFARDYPQYPVRAIMMDVARIYIPLDYVEEITRYAAYFKINEVRLHINDGGGEQAASFRVESKKFPALNEGITTYSQEDYRNYQKEVRKYGVEVITEIDTPAHSEVFAKVHPELMLPDGYHLDVTNPATIEFIKEVLDEFLDGDDPVFQGSKFHIGTDEYDKQYSEDLRKYMDELITYVNGKGLETRMWASLGTNGFNGTTPVNSDATAHIWSHGWASWKEMLDDGYNLINNADGALYIVPEGAYNNYINIERLFDTWEVSDLLYGNYLDTGHPQLLGAESAIWYDAANGQSEFDYFDRIRDQIMLMSEKNWHGNKGDDQTGNEFIQRVSKVDQYAPQSNPARYVKSNSEIVGEYKFESDSNGEVKDHSGNDYSAKLNNIIAKDGKLKLNGSGYLSLPFASIGYPYTVQFDLLVDASTPANAIIFSGKEGTLYYNYDNSGKLAYERKGYIYYFDFKVPIGTMTAFTITCDQREATLYVDGYKVGSGKYYQQTITHLQESSTFVLPVQEIGSGIIGELDNLRIYNRVLSENEVLDGETLEYRNLALHKKVTASSVDGGVDSDGNLINPDYAPELAVDGDRATRHVFTRKEEDSWFIVDLGETCLIDKYTIRFMEIPVSYKVSISLDGTNWTEVALKENLPGRASIADGVEFNNCYKARYVKYEQLEMFEIDGYGYYSGYFNEFEIYGYEYATIDNTIKEAKKIIEDIEVVADNKVYLEKFNQNVKRLETLLAGDSLDELSQLTALVQQQIKKITDGNTVKYDLKTEKLEQLIFDTAIQEDDFDEAGWLAYSQAVSYGKVIYYDLHTNQDKVDEAVRKIQEIRDSIQLVAIRATMPIYIDANGNAYDLHYMLDGDPLTKAWFTQSGVGNYIQFKFRETQNLSSIKIATSDNGWDLFEAGTIDVSLDGETWIKVGDISNEKVNEIIFAPTEARYVRLNVLKPSGWIDIGEVQFNGKQLVDTLFLQREINKEVSKDDYTIKSYEAYVGILTEAKNLLSEEDYTQIDVDKLKDQLIAARGKLIKVSTLKEAIAILKTEASKSNIYTPSSIKKANTIITKAELLLVDGEKEKIDEAIKNLNNFTFELIIDKTGLEALVKECDSLAANDYTSKTWNELMVAVESAKKVILNADANNKLVEDAIKNLTKTKEALASLVLLRSTIGDFEANLNDITYTPDSISNAQIVFDKLNVDTVIANGTKEDVAKLIKQIKKIEFVKKADKTKLEQAINNSQKVLQSLDYTDKSKTELMIVVDKISAIYNDENATQLAVDEALELINAVELVEIKELNIELEKFAEKLNDEGITDDSKQKAQNLYNRAVSLKKNGKVQSIVEIVKELRNFKFEYISIRSELEQLIKDIKDLQSTAYTEESWNVLQTAVKKANLKLNNNASDKELKEVLQEVLKAKEALKIFQPSVNSMQTGDDINLAIFIDIMICMAGLGLIVRKKKIRM